MNRDDWNDRYRDAELLWSATPNQFVASELADLPAGRAIDLAAGEGRNAVWLAQRGWQVTAIDFSEVAIDRGRAADPDGRVDWRVGDVTTVSIEAGAYDLVLLAYLQLPWESMAAVLRRAAAGVARGGTFFLIGHDRVNRERGYGGPRSETVLYGPQQVAGELEGLDIVKAETVERRVDTPDGERVALDCLVRARR